jgi:hypothetical protein
MAIRYITPLIRIEMQTFTPAFITENVGALVGWVTDYPITLVTNPPICTTNILEDVYVALSSRIPPQGQDSGGSGGVEGDAG